mmetsp:Transcript_42136/g.45750  ORF Transcript_42136/g.45750 Transcript_42136/m.45750 type:complete len:94 (+) Transcript_42136:62-343(+)
MNIDSGAEFVMIENLSVLKHHDTLNADSALDTVSAAPTSFVHDMEAYADSYAVATAVATGHGFGCALYQRLSWYSRESFERNVYIVQSHYYPH